MARIPTDLTDEDVRLMAETIAKDVEQAKFDEPKRDFETSEDCGLCRAEVDHDRDEHEEQTTKAKAKG